MWAEVQEEVELELSLLKRLFQEHAELLAGVSEQEPGSTQVLALGAILQSFYNGCEDIFKRIAQEIDQEMPSPRLGTATCSRAWREEPPCVRP